MLGFRLMYPVLGYCWTLPDCFGLDKFLFLQTFWEFESLRTSATDVTDIYGNTGNTSAKADYLELSIFSATPVTDCLHAHVEHVNIRTKVGLIVEKSLLENSKHLKRID